MNYQVAPFWFYSARIAFMVVLAVALAFFSTGALMAYLLITGLAWPVLVSLRLHRLKERGLVSRDSDRSQWLVYINGIPVREERVILKNPCFALPDIMQQFFLRGFVVKTLIIAGLLTAMVWQIVREDRALLDPVNLLIATSAWILLSAFVRAVRALRALRQNRFRIQEVSSPGGSRWYQLSFMADNGTETAGLDALLAV